MRALIRDFRKLPGFIRRHLLLRQLPHGLISIHYLRPSPPPAIAEHRRLWLDALPGLPRPLFFALESWLWLRWVLYGAWRQSWHLLRRRGREIREEEGIGLLRQALRTLGPALCHTLAPRDIYLFRLYRSNRVQLWPQYVYERELPLFHTRRSAPLGGPDPESLKLLQDKLRLGERLERYGVGTVPVLEIVPRGASFDFERHLRHHDRLFCKTRSGNRARGAFVVEKGVDGTTRFFGTRQEGLVTGPCAGVPSWDRLEPNDYLVQPFVTNHPALAGLAGRDDAVTIRYISKQPLKSPIHCYCAVLEVPATFPDSKNARRECHLLFPIDPATGVAHPFPELWLPAEAKTRLRSILGKIASTPLPHWEELTAMAEKAHALFPSIHAIAWDFILSPVGPLLLEGNPGWAATVPQQLRGGLIDDH